MVVRHLVDQGECVVLTSEQTNTRVDYGFCMNGSVQSPKLIPEVEVCGPRDYNTVRVCRNDHICIQSKEKKDEMGSNDTELCLHFGSSFLALSYHHSCCCTIGFIIIIHQGVVTRIYVHPMPSGEKPSIAN
jgi:hypothetical protein